MLKVIIAVAQIHQPMITIPRKEIAIHIRGNKVIAKMNTPLHQLTETHTATEMVIVDSMGTEAMEIIGKFN